MIGTQGRGAGGGLSRRRFHQLIGGSAGVILAACGPLGAARSRDLSQATGERVTIEHYIFHDQVQQERMQAVYARFHDAYPSIRVEHLPAVGNEAQKREKMQTLVAGGTPPAVLGQIIAQFPSYYLLPGLIEPLDALTTADKVDKKRFSPTTFETFQYKGAQYALPYGASMELIAYNKELFEKQGVKLPPKTWDDSSWTLEEFLQRARVLTKAAAGGPAEQFGLARAGAHWTAWPLMWGSDWVSQDLARFLGTMQPVINSIQGRQDFVWKHHVAPQPNEGEIFGNLSSSQRFLSGKVAMADLGTWYLPSWIKQAQFAWDVAPWYRAGTTTAAGPIYPVGEAIGKGTKLRQQAWQLVKFLTYRPEINLDYAFMRGAGPALLTNLSPWRTLLSKEMPAMSAQIPADAIGKYGRVAVFHFVARFDDISKQIGPIVTKVENNELPAKTGLEQIAPQVQQMLTGG